MNLKQVQIQNIQSILNVLNNVLVINEIRTVGNPILTINKSRKVSKFRRVFGIFSYSKHIVGELDLSKYYNIN